MDELRLYSMLSTRSKRAIVKTKKRYGRPYHYSPRGDLLERLARQTGDTIEGVYNQLMKERKILLRSQGEDI